jgi:hypothetical protein
MAVFLFNTVIYVFLLQESMYSYCCLCIVIVRPCILLYILIVVYVFLDAATVTEVFPCFLLDLREMPGYN